MKIATMGIDLGWRPLSTNTYRVRHLCSAASPPARH